jgi:hypothetical protein
VLGKINKGVSDPDPGKKGVLAKFKVNPEYLRHAHLPEALVSTNRGLQTLAQLVARPSNVPQRGPTTT